MAEQSFVLGIEGLAQCVERRGLLRRAGHGDFVALAGVAQVERAFDADFIVGKTIAAQVVARLRLQLREHGVHVVRS